MLHSNAGWLMPGLDGLDGNGYSRVPGGHHNRTIPTYKLECELVDTRRPAALNATSLKRGDGLSMECGDLSPL